MRKGKLSAVNVGLLSTDLHVSVAQHTFVLPFVALDDYAYQKQSFSLDRKGDSESTIGALKQFLQDSADPKKPLALDQLSILVRTYGWNDSDMRQRQICSLLTRQWARTVCDNPWAAIQQALPSNSFKLVDLRRLQIDDPQGSAHCIDNRKPRRPLPQSSGVAVMVCEKLVYGGDPDKFHTSVIRIDGDLGVLWTVWRHGQNGETAEAMTEREGKALVAFLQYALGESEDFSKLHADMCRLRRPNSVDNPHGPDCGRTGLPALSLNQ